MKSIRKLGQNFARLSALNQFLVKGALLLALYYFVRILFKFAPVFRPVFLFARKMLTDILITTNKWVLELFGYNVNVYKKVIWIEGSQGIKVINACLGWSMMALFIGFLLIYPGKRISKVWYIPLGVVILQGANMLRILGMILLSYHHYGVLDFYHKYVFNFFLYLVSFILWMVWISNYGVKAQR